MKRVCVFYFFLCSLTVFSQTIFGTLSSDSKPIPFVSVLLKRGGVIEKFTTTDANGFYQIKFVKPTDSLSVSISTLEFEPVSIKINTLSIVNNEIKLDIVLSPRVSVLEEVVIKKTPPIVVKKDTTEFNPASFRDGSEKVVEDLLKKLPGVSVDKKGTIKYNGKEISKLLLDGDDLFDSAYKIGSKNISVDMIEKVQGIDNYDENSLLKGIRESDNVALNLILKKGKTDLSGTALVGYGYHNRHDSKLTGLLVNSKIKGFGVAAFNNIGANNSPYDLDADMVANSGAAGENVHSKSLLSNGNFNSILDNSLHQINNNLYINGNTVQKISKKSSLKFNYGVFRDKITRINQSNSRISTGDEIFEINESNELQKSLMMVDFAAQLKNKEKSNFHYEVLTNFNFNQTNFSDNSINNGVSQNNSVFSRNFNVAQKFNATYKINENEALTAFVFFNGSKSPQNLTTNPATILDIDNQLFARRQNSSFEKYFAKIDANYLAKKGKFNYRLRGTYVDSQNKLTTNLLDNNSNSVGAAYQNDMNFNIKNFSFAPSIIFNSKKFGVRIGLNSLLIQTDLSDLASTNKKTEGFIMPKLTLQYQVGANSKMMFNYEFNQILPDETQTFSGIVQTNYRNFQNNDLSLEFLKTHNYSLSYSYSKFLGFQKLSLTLMHNYRPNNYFARTTINQNITVSTRFFANIANSNYSSILFAEKYYHPFRMTFQLNANFTKGFSNDIINNSSIRSIENTNTTINLTARRTIRKIITVENITFYNNSNFKIAAIDISNNFQMLTNETRVIYNINQAFNSSLSGNYIVPDLKATDKYFFLDYNINYSPRDKKMSYGLTAKNLTDNTLFTTNSVSSFSTNSNSHNLIGRYVLLSINYRF